jgi:hypothetical protein
MIKYICENLCGNKWTLHDIDSHLNFPKTQFPHPKDGDNSINYNKDLDI